ncbi:hypothetical protein ABIC65_001057 [Sphingomonas trueperi]|uniref:hypothetical protein n=1 Tax=Sphingomonas trueperi TaxID=53317 RepID=UPI0033946108
MQYTNPNWPTEPRAVALLADITSNPPRMVRQLAPLSQCWDVSAPDFVMVYDRNDDRVDELSRMSDAAFRYVLDFQGDIAGAKRVAKLDDVIGLAVLRARKRAA